MDERWRTSTRSGDNGACVEVRRAAGVVEVRDSKDRGGPTLRFGPAQWTSLIADAKHGAFDR